MTHPPASQQPPNTTLTLSASEHALIQRTVLPSGLRVVTETLPGSTTAQWTAATTYGPRDEPPTARGSVHFYEHMISTGTPELPRPEVHRRLELTGEYNATTELDRMSCYVNGHADRVLQGGALYAYLLTHSEMPEEQVAHQRNVIGNEADRYADMPRVFLGQQVMNLLYQGHPLAHPVLGTPDEICGMTREVLSRTRHEMLRPDRMIITVTGRADHEAIVEQTRHDFADLVARYGEAAPEPPRPASPAVPQRSGQRVCPRDIEQAHLMVGIGGVGASHPQRDAFQLMMMALCWGQSSRLNRDLRTDRGLTYAVEPGFKVLADTGVGQMYTGCRPEHLPEIVERIRGHLARVSTGDITPDELHHAKTNLTTRMHLNRTDAAARTSVLLSNEMAGHHQSLEERLQAIDAVTVADVNAVAERCGSGAAVVEAVHGPVPTNALDD